MKNESFKPWVFADTGFVRNNQTLVSMAFMENHRRIPLPIAICKMERERQIEYLKQLIPQHQAYVRTLEGWRLPLWGAVCKYVCHIEPTLVIEISPDGEFIKEIHENVTNGGASLTVGGRLVVGVEP